MARQALVRVIVAPLALLAAGRVADARRLDANDVPYSTEAAMDYVPEPLPPRIRARVLAINSADDQVNPAELGAMEPGIAAIPGARFLLIPASSSTRGHRTYEQAALWKSALAEVMQ